MATARITHTFPDGTRDHLTIEVSESFPDCVDEARMQVTRMWRDVCCAEAEAETEDQP